MKIDHGFLLIFLVYGVFLIFILSFAVGIENIEEQNVSVPDNYYVFLEKGKNQVVFNESIYARDLVILNPNIESISYHDDFLGKSFGYVNAFGGIGKNFLITHNQVYEISVKDDTYLQV